MSKYDPMMKPGLKQEEEIFAAARLISDASARRSYLERTCGADVDLRQRVEDLLVGLGAAEDFFADGSSAVRTLGGELHAATQQLADEHIGTRIGNYKLLEKIGEGGCGVVYMAEQEKPIRRRVALKIIKLGMDTKSVIARFEAERQALALMDHSNIARVLDAGATGTGRPYFVMELVRGFKITDYCDANNLDTEQRLDLFIQVCHAIQHAHQKGIIHRDIKPSNILVTLHDCVPVPKVIDFGIAKATEAQLTEKTLFTAYAQIIGTPAYMSPEQAEMSGLDIDTRADIYSLGVLLYELLTGRTPFDAKQLLQQGFDEMRKTLREREPQKPSTILTTLQNEELTATAKHRQAEPPKLISQLRGDVDWIVMKALEKDRKRRYETANALAMDIQRFRNSEPVLACPPSRTYRLQKMVRRNKVVFASGAAVTLVLICGLAVSTWMFLREREARKRAVDAEREQATLRAIAERGRQTEAELRRQAEAREKITQAAALIDRHDLAAADRFTAEVPALPGTLEGARVFRTLGEWNAFQSRWAEAAARFSLLTRVGVLEGWDAASLDYTRAAVALIEADQLDQYRSFCHVALAQFRAAPDPIVTERTMKICLLLPPQTTLLADLKPLYDFSAQSLEQHAAARLPEDWMSSWRRVSVSLMDYRRGRMPEAIANCEACLTFGSPTSARAVTARIILAMAQFKSNGTKFAGRHLNEARERLNEKLNRNLEMGNGDDGYWFDWILARILFREATTLIENGR
jgi:serine/threonine protein kinase